MIYQDSRKKPNRQYNFMPAWKTSDRDWLHNNAEAKVMLCNVCVKHRALLNHMKGDTSWKTTGCKTMRLCKLF